MALALKCRRSDSWGITKNMQQNIRESNQEKGKTLYSADEAEQQLAIVEKFQAFLVSRVLPLLLDSLASKTSPSVLRTRKRHVMLSTSRSNKEWAKKGLRPHTALKVSNKITEVTASQQNSAECTDKPHRQQQRQVGG